MKENDKYIGKILDDRYEILEVIGEGGMAVVYKAMCNRLNRLVAVKILREEMEKDEEFRRRFYAESQAVAMLSHPNIVAVYDVSHSENLEYIVMELINGITLRQYMNKRGALAWKEVVHFGKQITKALIHAHERGIIHQDIKPQNIMLLRDGTIKVADFGIAALENEIHEGNEAIGSLHYISPEQAHGEPPNARGDIFSLGILMYEMLTAKLPYDGETPAEVSMQHLGEKPKFPHSLVDGVPPGLERVIMKALEVDPLLRYQTAKELLYDINAFIQSYSEELLENDTPPDVIPVRSVTELSVLEYREMRKRASKVTFLVGVFCSLLVASSLFVFLWNFWLGDLFSTAQRIDMPNFVGMSFNDVINDVKLATTYRFTVEYTLDASSPAGTILSQDPGEGRSVMLVNTGVETKLVVNSGNVTIEVPDVVNKDYREAKLILERAGFVVEIESETSQSVTKDYVISTSPVAGIEISNGTTIYLRVSAGPEIVYVETPNLVGLTEDAAIAKLEATHLSYGGTTREKSDIEAGTVLGQSINAFTLIEEHTKIYLTVSSGK